MSTPITNMLIVFQESWDFQKNRTFTNLVNRIRYLEEAQQKKAKEEEREKIATSWYSPAIKRFRSDYKITNWQPLPLPPKN